MAILEIKKAGDPVLKEQAQAVTKVDRRVRQLLEDMAQTMYEAEGVGLAAPQIGVLQRIIVIDAGEGLIGLINPEVVVKSDDIQTASEGCLSIPGVYGDVERHAEVTVEGLDRSGKKIRIEAEGLLARALQHEIDHLNGILFIERAKTVYKGKD